MSTSRATRGAQPSTEAQSPDKSHATDVAAAAQSTVHGPGSDPHGTAQIRARIKTALEQMGMNQTHLAQESGLSTSAMSRLMSGKRDISAGELGVLAQALSKSVSWLAADPADTSGNPAPWTTSAAASAGKATASGTHSRTLAFAARLVARAGQAGADGNAALQAATARAFDLVEVEAELDLLVSAPAPELPTPPPVPKTTYKKLAGQEMAAKVRAAFDLGVEPIEDLTAFAWAVFGLRVAREPLGDGIAGLLATDSTGGRSSARLDGAFVPALALVNTAGTRLGRQRYTAAHELAHLLFNDARDDMHADYVNQVRDEDFTELRANEFAAELLMPKQGIAAIAERAGGGRDEVAGTTPRVQWCRQLVGTVAAHYGASVESAGIRCEVLAFITAQEKQRIYSMGATAVLRGSGFDAYAEADEAAIGVTDPPESLSGKALYAYTEHLIGLGTLGRVWNTSDLTGLRADLAAAGWEPTRP